MFFSITLLVYSKHIEKCENIKGVIWSHKSKKDRQYNGQKEKGQKDKQRSTKHYTEN
jgi:hypothetical protein